MSHEGGSRSWLHIRVALGVQTIYLHLQPTKGQLNQNPWRWHPRKKIFIIP